MEQADVVAESQIEKSSTPLVAGRSVGDIKRRAPGTKHTPGQMGRRNWTPRRPIFLLLLRGNKASKSRFPFALDTAQRLSSKKKIEGDVAMDHFMCL